MVAYEQHANGLWMNYLATVSNHPNGGQLAAESEKWLWHIAGCYRSWFDWLEDVQSPWTEDVAENLATQYARMSAFISNCNLEEPRTRTQEPYGSWQWMTCDVIHHALTHGVYHRGHLRALAEFHGFEDWPDTDWDEFAGKQVG